MENGFSLFPILYVFLFIIYPEELCIKRWRLFSFQRGRNTPVFPWRKCPDILFPVYDKSERNGLYPACAETPPHFAPQER